MYTIEWNNNNIILINNFRILRSDLTILNFEFQSNTTHFCRQTGVRQSTFFDKNTKKTPKKGRKKVEKTEKKKRKYQRNLRKLFGFFQQFLLGKHFL